MRAEWGEDEGYTAAKYQREKLVNGFRKLRAEIDAQPQRGPGLG
jgi:hypothetical protein